ncbi:MAG: NAD-dependent epimerase/dehydratase family protein [Pseudomonadota bacterium]
MNPELYQMLIIGCGDIGRRLIAQSNPERPAFGVVRSQASATALEGLGGQAVIADLDAQSPDLSGLPPQAQWFYLAPPPREGQSDARLARFLAGVSPESTPARVLYLSTSSVYGDCGGDWVTEESPLNPGTDRGHRRADAEKQWQRWCDQHGVELQIVRVPGIVGDGRDRLERLQNCEPLLDPSESTWTNVIHQDDLARLLLALSARAPAGTYNISDDHPTTSTERSLRLCEQNSIAKPGFIKREEAEENWSEMRLSFLKESRRLNINKIKTTLGQDLFQKLVQHQPA